MSAADASPPSPSALGRRTFGIISCAALASAMGNTGLISVLPTIGRSLHIPDSMVAGIFSLSSVMWAICSPMWARVSDHRGRKPLMLLGLSGFTTAFVISGLIVSAGLHQFATPTAIFLMLLVARCVFGIFGSATNPATQAYVAERTPPSGRTQALANLAGSQGLGTVLGPALAPLFILPIIGLAGPLYCFAAIAAVILVMVWRYLPEAWTPPSAAERAATAAAVKSGPAIWRDARVTPFLIYGFVVAICQTAQQQTLGFLIIDRLHLDPRAAQGAISMAMAFGAVSGLLAQWGLIRMFEMTPRQLLRWGAVVAALGNLVVALSPDYWMAVAGFVISSLGFGFARPGFTAGSSLAVDSANQARVAGAIASINGINVVFAPLFVLIYERVHRAPFVINMALLMAMLAFAFRNRALRNADPTPATREDTAVATLERADEGGV